MSICKVCDKKVANMGAKIIRGKSGEWVCKNCLKEANIGAMKFSNTFISADEIKCIINGTEFVPEAPTKAKKPKKNNIGAIIGSVIAVICLVAVVIAALGTSEPSTSDATSIDSVNQGEAENLYETKKDLITFEGVKAEFIKVYDPKAGVTALAVALNLENTSDQEYTVSLTNGYVNDTKVQFMTGLPVTVAPGKKAVGVFTFGYDGLGFSKIEEIEKIEFKLGLLTSDAKLKESKTITLNFK